MKAISETRLETFEDVAIEGVKQIKAYFAYQGSEPRYREKAKVGAATIGAYARMRASETNRMAIELAVGKAVSGSPEQKRLSR